MGRDVQLSTFSNSVFAVFTLSTLPSKKVNIKTIAFLDKSFVLFPQTLDFFCNGSYPVVRIFYLLKEMPMLFSIGYMLNYHYENKSDYNP